VSRATLKDIDHCDVAHSREFLLPGPSRAPEEPEGNLGCEAGLVKCVGNEKREDQPYLTHTNFVGLPAAELREACPRDSFEQIQICRRPCDRGGSVTVGQLHLGEQTVPKLRVLYLGQKLDQRAIVSKWGLKGHPAWSAKAKAIVSLPPFLGELL